MPYTPMMQQYLKTKESYKDCILFYRLGDFYEMFFDDAITVSRELELTLTGKNCGMEERAPMCGVPHHAVDIYLPRLVEKGYKVAVCEQVEDPKLAKGIVKREVTRIVTPGTNMSSAMENEENIYIASIIRLGDTFGYAISDVSTGEFYYSEYMIKDRLFEELFKRMPREIICNNAFLLSDITETDRLRDIGVVITTINDESINSGKGEEILREHFKQEKENLSKMPIGAIAAGELFGYLLNTQMTDLSHITNITELINDRYMGIDSFSFRNLELIETMREKEKKGSLFWVLDKTKTAMGARLLKSYIRAPLMDIDSIEERLDAVSEFKDEMILREELREYLDRVYDIERLLTRISYKTAGPRDLLAFKNSISILPAVKTVLSEVGAKRIEKMQKTLDTLEDICELLEASISDDPHEGDIIKEGFIEEIDRLKNAKTDGKQWLANLEEKERNETGIKNLKIKYNRVFGYYLEVTNSNLDMVPSHYIRKQTLANCERFFTPELKELEDTVLGAQDKLYRLESDTFKEILEKVAGEIKRIKISAGVIAELDVYLSLATVASKNRYKRPLLNNKGNIEIKDGRHPVVELMTGKDDFIANDTFLDDVENRLVILTGPNMAGKSTYMRQTALIVLMAQMGSFVPAEYANIGIVDRIFTRVGASDDLASGQSTFMVEMHEMANILKNAGKNSLVILDEIGRGTSTFDGLSLAWSIAEYICNRDIIGAKTMFATHYHEMTELENEMPGVKNYSIAVREKGDDIIFLRKIIPGGADKSYGIQVAKLAGVPEEVLLRAKEILGQLIEKEEKSDKGKIEKSNVKESVPVQLSFFGNDSKIISDIKSVNIESMTPIEALNYLYELKEKASKL